MFSKTAKEREKIQKKTRNTNLKKPGDIVRISTELDNRAVLSPAKLSNLSEPSYKEKNDASIEMFFNNHGMSNARSEK